MPRNAEVIRQWKILRTLEASRQGETIAGLARQCEVTTRTIWRDIVALQDAGFPLVDEKPDGRTRWKLLPGGLKGLQDSALTMSELASLVLQPGARAVPRRHTVSRRCRDRDGQSRCRAARADARVS